MSEVVLDHWLLDGWGWDFTPEEATEWYERMNRGAHMFVAVPTWSQLVRIWQGADRVVVTTERGQFVATFRNCNEHGFAGMDDEPTFWFTGTFEHFIPVREVLSIEGVEVEPEPEDCEHGLSAWLCAGPMHYPTEV